MSLLSYIDEVIKQTPLAGKVKDRYIEGNELVLVIPESEVKNMLFEGTYARFKDSIDVRLRDGRLEIRIRIA
jgi:hypothetical protein